MKKAKSQKHSSKQKEDKYTKDLLNQKDKFCKRLKECREKRKLSHEKLSIKIEEAKNIFISDKALKTYEVSEKNHSDYKKALGLSYYRFLTLADFFGVSLDYMAGRVECQSPRNQKIHELTGLSEKSINVLKNANKNKKEMPTLSIKLDIINYLIENMNNNDFLENMYNYLFAEFAIPDTKNENYVHKKLHCVFGGGGYSGETVLNADSISEIFSSEIRNELVRMKDKIRNSDNK